MVEIPDEARRAGWDTLMAARAAGRDLPQAYASALEAAVALIVRQPVRLVLADKADHARRQFANGDSDRLITDDEYAAAVMLGIVLIGQRRFTDVRRWLAGEDPDALRAMSTRVVSVAMGWIDAIEQQRAGGA